MDVAIPTKSFLILFRNALLYDFIRILRIETWQYFRFENVKKKIERFFYLNVRVIELIELIEQERC